MMTRTSIAGLRGLFQSRQGKITKTGKPMITRISHTSHRNRVFDEELHALRGNCLLLFKTRQTCVKEWKQREQILKTRQTCRIELKQGVQISDQRQVNFDAANERKMPHLYTTDKGNER
jgi:hypothetical protein